MSRAHGTYAAYVVDRCRCDACTGANRDYARDLRRTRAYGRPRLVDAGPARRHVRDLIDAGIGLRTIIAATGVSSGCLWKLVYGRRGVDGVQRPSARISPRTEARLLGFDGGTWVQRGMVKIPARLNCRTEHGA